MPALARALQYRAWAAGASRTAGQLLPVGWTESQLAKMSNCSLLMTGRMDVMSVMSRSWWPGSGPDHHYNKTNVMNRNRGFARSDDGGHTWGEVWYLSARPGHRQPQIGIHDTFVNEALTSSADGSTMYWARPRNVTRSRSNYTLHSSRDGGASLGLNRVYGAAAPATATRSW